MSLTPERYARAEALFQAVLEREEPEREAYLEATCTTDPALRQLVAELLAAHAATGPIDRLAERLQQGVEALESRLSAALAGRYAIERELGRGGAAIVYLAWDLPHDRPVALKVLRPELAASLGAGRFLREIEIAAKLHHPHILPLYDSGAAEGLLYYVMPFAEGKTLRERLQRERQLPLEEALAIAGEVADALSYAHEHGVVHRDIKPENLLLESGHAVVADFGIARAISVAGAERLTETGLAIGTPAYMSPEQAAGEAQLDERSDLYSLACVLYEMLGGEPPFTGPSAQAVLARHALDPVPPLRTLRPTVPAGIEHAVERALAKVPADRFASVQEFAQALAQAEAAEDAPGTSSRFFAARLPTFATLIIVAFLALWFIPRPAGPPSEQTVPVPRVAVLPFENLGPPGDQYFADGITEEITARLARQNGLMVLGRASALRYGDGSLPSGEIGRELGADYLLRGAVRWQRAGEGVSQVRITPRLIRVQDEAQVWADQYDRVLSDIFAVQSEIAAHVAEALGVTLFGGWAASARSLGTRNLQAYDAYLRGNFLMAQRDSQMVAGAIEQFRHALQLDPAFSAALAGIASAYGQLAVYGWGPPGVSRDSLRFLGLAMADSSLALDPDSPDAWVARGYLLEHIGDHRLREARSAVETAIRLDPRNAEAYNRLSWVLLAMGGASAAEVRARRTLEFEPTWYLPYFLLGRAAFAQGRPSEALVRLDTVIALAPDYQAAYYHRARVRLALGDAAGARADAALAGRWGLLTAPLVDAASGRREAAEAAVNRALGSDPDRAEALDYTEAGYGTRMRAAAVLTALGDHERALDLLESAWEATWFYSQLIQPEFSSLQQHPRYQRLVARARWRATGT